MHATFSHQARLDQSVLSLIQHPWACPRDVAPVHGVRLPTSPIASRRVIASLPRLSEPDASRAGATVRIAVVRAGRGLRMSDLGSSLSTGVVDQSEVSKGHELSVWMLTTPIFGLIGYPVIFYLYHNEDPHKWPSWDSVLGQGDLAFVVFAILGATLAEVVIFRNSLRAGWFALILVVSVVSGLWSFVVFTAAQVHILDGAKQDTFTNAVVLLSLLAAVVIMHVVLVLYRRRKAA
jgi:hypothetical protein